MNSQRVVRFICILAILASPVLLSAQNPTPTPSPEENEVVKISTNLIQVDVTVTDKNGKIVRDLRPDEIEIYQNGKKQEISNFSFISNTRETTEGEKTTITPSGVPLPPVPIKAENVKRTIALVVDDLTLSFESTYYARRALKKFVDEQMRDGDLVAIVRTGAGIGALQQFTTDKRQLYAAIEKVRWNVSGTGRVSTFAPLEAKEKTEKVPMGPTPAERAQGGTGGEAKVPTEKTPKPGERTQEGIEREFNDFKAAVFATGSLGAVNYVVNGMSELPGRKSIMLFSDGFRLFTKDAAGFTESGSVLQAVRALIDKATRASVVIYTVDPRGVVVVGLTAADDTKGRSLTEIQAAESGRREELTDTRDGLTYLAKETGGFAITNTNDISGGIRRILDDQSYYLIGYVPDDETFDPKKKIYNKLAVRVTRSDTLVRYRSGFFNVEEKAAPKPSAALTPIAQLQNALVSPFAVNGINLRLNALFGDEAGSGSYVRSLLHVNARDLKFTDEKDGSKQAVFDVLALSFGDNGQVVDSLGKTHTLNVTPDLYKTMLEDGFVYQFVFPVKKAGAYQYRVAIRDAQGGKVGSASQFIEVPNLKKGRLTLSSIVLANLSQEEWRRLSTHDGGEVRSDPTADTALRQAKRGSVLQYAFEIYNAKLNPAKQPQLESRIRMFRDGKLVLDGEQKPLDLQGQTDVRHLKLSRALSVGRQMEPGDYVLQIIVTDTLANAQNAIATQYVQFEVVE